MNLFEPTLFAVARSLIIALAATSVAWGVRRDFSGRNQGLLWLGAAVFCIPGMLSGYVFSSWARSLEAKGWILELAYIGFTFLRLLPIALIAVSLTQPSVSKSGIHCFSLANIGFQKRLFWKARALAANAALPATITFLFAFQEFDVATSWGVRTWTVALFDAQTGGLKLSESLQMAAFPLALELCVMGFLLKITRGLPASREEISDPTEISGASRPLLRDTLVFISVAVAGVIPLLFLVHRSWPGLRGITENFSISRECLNSILIASITTFLTMWAATQMRASKLRLLLLVPGLLGSLLLGLLLIPLFQLPLLDAASSSIAPLLVGLILQLLPLATGLLLLHQLGSSQSARHIADLSRAPVLWDLKIKPRLFTAILLFGCAYGDFAINAILAPPQFAGAFNRIFNLMHYGQSAALSAMVLSAILIPLILVAAAGYVARFYFTGLAGKGR